MQHHTVTYGRQVERDSDYAEHASTKFMVPSVIKTRRQGIY